MKGIEKKNILIISPEAWGTCFVSKHHYAINLAKNGNKVFFMAKNQKTGTEITSGLILLDLPEIPKGLRFYPTFLRKNIHRKIGNKLSKMAGCNFDLIWSFDSSVLFDLECIGPKAFRILHVVDLSMEFEWEKAAQSANLCLGSSTLIVNRLQSINHNSHFIQHGVEIYERTVITFKNDRKRVMYAGNLNIKYLDRPRLIRLVGEYPDVDFHFIGDQGHDNLSEKGSDRLSDLLRAKENAIFHQAMSPNELRNWLYSSDVLLICYNPLYYDQISNPHKVMEYLSCGKPILSTILDEYKSNTDLIAMLNDEETYISKLKELLVEDDFEKTKSRIAFANNNIYFKQLERISKLYYNTLNNNN